MFNTITSYIYYLLNYYNKDDWLSLDKHAEIKEFIESELTKRNCIFPEKWHIIDGTMVDNIEFTYNNVEYHMFVSCRKNDTFGFGLAKVYNMTWNIAISDTYNFKGYKETLLEIFDTYLKD